MWPMVVFWGLFALAQSLGLLTSLVTGEAFESGLMLHDATAYPLIAMVSCLCAATGPRLHRVSRIMVVAGAVSLCLQFANGMGIFSMPGVDPWYWERFRGWASFARSFC